MVIYSPGPELEIWSLGVLLYVLIFSENPFFSIDETIACQLFPPHTVSPFCQQLIKDMLTKDPKDRITLEHIRRSEWLNMKVDITKYSFGDLVQASKSSL